MSHEILRALHNKQSYAVLEPKDLVHIIEIDKTQDYINVDEMGLHYGTWKALLYM